MNDTPLSSSWCTGYYKDEETGEMVGPVKIKQVGTIGEHDIHFEAGDKPLVNYEVVVIEDMCHACIRRRRCIWTLNRVRVCTECLVRWQKMIAETDDPEDGD